MPYMHSIHKQTEIITEIGVETSTGPNQRFLATLNPEVWVSGKDPVAPPPGRQRSNMQFESESQTEHYDLVA
jgi:hypothetical protein